MVGLSLDTHVGPAHDQEGVVPQEAPSPTDGLPRWPVAAMFALYPLWWLLGVLDMAVIPLALVMTVYLLRTPGVRVPRGFALWMLFLLWAACSIVELTSFTSMIGFGFRFAIYVSATVFFVYVYNARKRLDTQYVLGLLTVVWMTTVVGGYLGVLFPGVVVRTPASVLVNAIKAFAPGTSSILSNELVQYMVVRRFAQYSPDSFFGVAPRPVAPFRFANNWGNAYSILLPLVVAWTLRARPRTKMIMFGLVLPLSVIPAFLTLNRGMFLGIGITMVYIAFRQVMRGRPQVLLMMVVVAVLGVLAFSLLGVQERIDTRLNKGNSSNDTRASLYAQSLQSVPDSPLFGYGAPKGGDDPNAPPVGTQGQVWVLLVSHGPVALVSAVGWLGLVVVQSRRRVDATGLAAHTSVLVGTLELVYYGVVPYGLPLMMTAAALALRPEQRRGVTEPAAQPVVQPATQPVVQP